MSGPGWQIRRGEELNFIIRVTMRWGKSGKCVNKYRIRRSGVGVAGFLATGTRVPGLDALSAAFLVAGPVKAVALAATLLRKATRGSAAAVLSVLVAVDHLHPPELDHGCEVYIYHR